MSSIQSDDEQIQNSFDNSPHKHTQTLSPHPSKEITKESDLTYSIMINKKYDEISQIDELHHKICINKQKPKELLAKWKSDGNLKTLNQTKQLRRKSKQREEDAQNELTNCGSYLDYNNYKRLFQQQFQKNKILSQKIEKLEDRYAEMRNSMRRLKEENTVLRDELKKNVRNKDEEKIMMKRLDQKVKSLKKRQNEIQANKKKKEIEEKREIKKLKEQNINYQIFVSALGQSIRILKGKNVKQLTDIWREWKSVLQLASLKRCKLGV